MNCYNSCWFRHIERRESTENAIKLQNRELQLAFTRSRLAPSIGNTSGEHVIQNRAEEAVNT